MKDKSLPGINSSIRKQMNQRYRLLKEAKSTGDQDKWIQYKSKRNTVKKLLKSVEATYWNKTFKESKNPKEFWKLTNQVLGKTKVKSIGPIIDN